MSDTNNKSDGKFGLYASSRVIAGIIVAAALLVGGVYLIKFFSGSSEGKSPYQKVVENNPTLKKMNNLLDEVIVEETVEKKVEEKADVTAETQTGHTVAEHKESDQDVDHSTPEADVKKTAEHKTTAADEQHGKTADNEIKPIHDSEKAFGTVSKAEAIHVVRGSRFATALIEPIDHELNERFYGWRPNDVFSFFTDNVANEQLGVLEVTKRTSEKLVERIAKTGSTITFDKNLNIARSKFQNDPKKYWLPSPENEYNDGIEEIKKYRERLNKGKATFHARADNLVPLLEAYENLLGDCDESLVKRKERNGTTVSTFKADNYFYYSKGVAKAMKTILEAVLEDFGPVLESRGAAADLHHAMLKLEEASHLEPLFVQESNLSGVFANHRANMATFISHARSYIQFVIKTMTT